MIPSRHRYGVANGASASWIALGVGRSRHIRYKVDWIVNDLGRG